MRRAAQLSTADLAAADLDAQKEILDLLNIRVIPSEDGYTIQGTLPYWPTERGKMASEAPQHLYTNVPAVRFTIEVAA